MIFMVNELKDKEQIIALKSEIEHLIDLLWRDRNIRNRRKYLSRLKNDVGSLSEACNNLLIYVESFNADRSLTDSLTISQRTFTKAELAQYDGKSGNPAYVAVNGTIYDVTNNAAWAAATHFGLSAGNDLTSQYSSCHAGQQVLRNLTIVGSLIDG